jgi:hypothetical protein
LGFYILVAFCGYHAMRHATERDEVVPAELARKSGVVVGISPDR